MEYISAEEFLKQPDEVMKVLVNWWKVNERETDLVYLFLSNGNETRLNSVKIQKCNLRPISEIIPLLTEGQLRKFIQGKTHKIAIIEFDYDHYNLVLTNGYVFKTDKKDLLQAYWEVALEIAKEKVKS